MTNHRCDVHVLTQDASSQYWDQCFTSLESEPVNVYRMAGIAGHIGDARVQGFARGTAEYISFVDDDDYVLPGAFEACISFLDANPDYVGVGTRELVQPNIESEDLEESPMRAVEITATKHVRALHHIVVMRRDVVQHHVSVMHRFQQLAERSLYIELLVHGYKFKKLNIFGYVWRSGTNGSHTTAYAVHTDFRPFLRNKRMELIINKGNNNMDKQERCDVHVVVLETDDTTIEQCVTSLESEPVNVHITHTNTTPHLGRARFAGYGKGIAEFVSFVDGGDYVLPGAFKACVDYLDSHPNISGVCTREVIMHGPSNERWDVSSVALDVWDSLKDTPTLPSPHLFVARRSVVDKYRAKLADFEHLCDRALMIHMVGNHHHIGHINFIGYHRKQYDTTTRRTDVPALAALRSTFTG